MAPEYAGDGIAVQWEPKLCIHARECVNGMPGVFDPQARPWISADEAAGRADELAAVIQRCPSGALHYRRLDGAAEETAGDGVRIVVQADGPLYVRGRLAIKDANGTMIRDDVRTALCRCGASGNKPFCDNSHFAVGFTAP